MRVLSYLRMEIDPYQIEAFEEDLEEMIWMAREMPGFLGVEVFRARTEPNVYLVLDSSGHGPSDAPGGSGVRFRVWLISSQT